MNDQWSVCTKYAEDVEVELFQLMDLIKMMALIPVALKGSGNLHVSLVGNTLLHYLCAVRTFILCTYAYLGVREGYPTINILLQ